MTLRVLEIHPTLACNIACTFCGLRTLEATNSVGELRVSGEGPARGRLEERAAWSIRRHVSESEVPLPALIEAVSAAADLGCRVLTISGGGEPLAAPERTFALLAAGRRAGMITRLVTNGTLLARFADRVSDLDVLTLSVLGPDPASHDRAAGRPGAFDRLCEGVASVEVSAIEVFTALTAEVLARMERMADLVHALGATTWFVLPLKGKPRVEVPSSAAAYATSLGLQHNLGHRRASGGGCVAAEAQLVIHADGTVTPCCAMRWGSGDLLDRPLDAVWRGHWLTDVREVLRAGRRSGPCADCEDPSRETRAW